MKREGWLDDVFAVAAWVAGLWPPGSRHFVWQSSREPTTRRRVGSVTLAPTSGGATSGPAVATFGIPLEAGRLPPGTTLQASEPVRLTRRASGGPQTPAPGRLVAPCRAFSHVEKAWGNRRLPRPRRRRIERCGGFGRLPFSHRLDDGTVPILLYVPRSYTPAAAERSSAAATFT
jgi:hypothetical protein